MTLIRCKILNAGIDNKILDDMPESFLTLGIRLTNEFDMSRYRNYKIMYLIKQGKLLDATSLAESHLVEASQSPISPFDLFWCIKAVNDALLERKSINIELLDKLIREVIKGIDLTKKGHPTDLVLRELALYEYQLNNKSIALRYIRKCKNSFDLVNSEIALWLKILIDVHTDFINDNINNLEHYFKPLKKNTFVSSLVEEKSCSDILIRLRYLSPY